MKTPMHKRIATWTTAKTSGTPRRKPTSAPACESLESRQLLSTVPAMMGHGGAFAAHSLRRAHRLAHEGHAAVSNPPAASTSVDPGGPMIPSTSGFTQDPGAPTPSGTTTATPVAATPAGGGQGLDGLFGGLLSSGTSTSGDSKASGFEKLQTDLQAIYAKSQVTPVEVAALQTDVTNLKAAETGTPSTTDLQAVQNDVTAIGNLVPTSDQLTQLGTDFTTAMTNAGVTDSTLISQTMTDLEAIITSSNITATDMSTIASDTQAIQGTTTDPSTTSTSSDSGSGSTTTTTTTTPPSTPQTDNFFTVLQSAVPSSPATGSYASVGGGGIDAMFSEDGGDTTLTQSNMAIPTTSAMPSGMFGGGQSGGFTGATFSPAGSGGALFGSGSGVGGLSGLFGSMQQSSITASFQKLQTDLTSIYNKSQVTPALATALQTDVKSLSTAETKAPTSADLTAVQNDIKAIGTSLPTSDQLTQFATDFTTAMTDAGVTNSTLISQTITDLQAIITASNITATDLSTLTADYQAIQDGAGGSAPSGSTTSTDSTPTPGSFFSVLQTAIPTSSQGGGFGGAQTGTISGMFGSTSLGGGASVTMQQGSIPGGPMTSSFFGGGSSGGGFSRGGRGGFGGFGGGTA